MQTSSTPTEISEVEAASLVLRASAAATMQSLEGFSSWLVGGAGAAAGLLIVNLDKLLTVLTRGSIRFALGFLVLSLVFGTIAKMQAAIFAKQSAATVPDDLKARLQSSPNFSWEHFEDALFTTSGVSRDQKRSPRTPSDRGKRLYETSMQFSLLVILQMFSTIGAVIAVALGMLAQIVPD